MCVVAVERSKLYEQVWSIPSSQLAALYGISDVGLAKVCKRYNIPRPPRGYWASLAAGQRIRKPRLPSSMSEDDVVYLKGWQMPDEAIQQVITDRVPMPSDHPSHEGPLHPLALATKELLATAKADSEGLIRASTPALHVQLSQGTLERVVALWDSLVKTWERRGGSVLLSASINADSPPTALAIGADAFGVMLVETVDDSRPLTDSSRLTGKLAVHITGDERHNFRRRWSDTKSQRLERLLNPIVDTLVNALAVKCQERLDAECVDRQRKRAEAIRKAATQRESREFYWRQDLMQQVEQWHASQKVRTYLNVLRAAIDNGDPKLGKSEDFHAWLVWAEKYAETLDPISQKQLEMAPALAAQVVSVVDLDLTHATRETINRLGVADTNELYQATQDAVRKACEGKFGATWNEIGRVLEGLAYDVSKRETASEWW